VGIKGPPGRIFVCRDVLNEENLFSEIHTSYKAVLVPADVEDQGAG